MSARSARRPVPALVFLLALAILAIVVWVRVADRDSAADTGATPKCATTTTVPANASVTISALNGTDKPDLASQTVAAFVAVGFAQGGADNAPAPYDGIAIITVGPNGEATGKLVQFYLPGAVIQTDARQDLSATVTVGAQYTALAAPAAVAAAMKKDGVVQQAAPAAGATTPVPQPSPTCTPSS